MSAALEPAWRAETAKIRGQVMHDLSPDWLFYLYRERAIPPHVGIPCQIRSPGGPMTGDGAVVRWIRSLHQPRDPH
jgi:hypothetical protein